MKKQYIIRKYILASNAREALRLERSIQADECWIDAEWQKSQPNLVSPPGFRKR